MPYSNSQGYVPRTATEIMEALRLNMNDVLGTDYTTSEFSGTNFYKVVYPVMQEIMATENNLSIIFSKLVDFIDKTNESINAPSVVRDMLIKKINEIGVNCSLKQITKEEAGNLYLCCDISEGQSDYNYLADQIADILLKNTAGGIYTNGTQEVSKLLDNGQVEVFKFYLPTKTAIKCRLTLRISRNNSYYIPTDDEAKEILLNNLSELYYLGEDFEPEKYAEIERDFPCCSEVILEYSLDNGASYITDVAQLDFNVKYTVAEEDITIVRT